MKSNQEKNFLPVLIIYFERLSLLDKMPVKRKITRKTSNPKTTGEEDVNVSSVVGKEPEVQQDGVESVEEEQLDEEIAIDDSVAYKKPVGILKSPHRSFEPSAQYLAAMVCNPNFDCTFIILIYTTFYGTNIYFYRSESCTNK